MAYKYAGLPIYGDDLRAVATDVPLAVYRRTMVHFPFVVLHAPARPARAASAAAH
ncbi:hypothetical protein HC891_27745, partial [Candidatus Gracilibacteria bacterium]|nr:hypothetical protein [Candidatus Gracilibacteria bacterium]